MVLDRYLLCVLGLLPAAACGAWREGVSNPMDSYFRLGDLEPEPEYEEIDELWRELLSYDLRAIAEPRLAPGSSDPPPTCRFLYLRSFDPTICVRLEHDPAGLRIMSTVSEFGLEADSPQPPLRSVERREFVRRDLTWRGLRQRLAHGCLWWPRGSTEEELLTLDGAQWILELRDGDEYRVVHRHSPEARGPYADFRKLCLELLGWGEVTPAAGKVY